MSARGARGARRSGLSARVAGEGTAIDPTHVTLARLARQLRIRPGTRVSLSRDHDPAHTAGFAGEGDAAAELAAGIVQLARYQSMLAAQDVHGVLVVLQGLDASGKDGTVKHVMSGVNPAGVAVHSFKVPSEEELRHDYLWRYASALPRRGAIGIFNRSHYEEVLVVRVHRQELERQPLPSRNAERGMWARRFREINAWERYLVDNGIAVVKIVLNVSRDEQRRRLLRRIDDPEKRWKFSSADVDERQYWSDYQRAYSAMLSATSTEWAPWHVVPADQKWFAHLATAAIILEALRSVDPRYPEIGPAQQSVLARARKQLERAR